MDAILTGGGHSLRECRQLLLRAGFQIGTELDEDDRCPVVVGDTAHLFSQALQLVESGRHTLITNPSMLSAAQVARLLSVRKPRQAFYLWNERRHHPAYRLMSRLVRADEAGWRPRHVRHLTLSGERPTAAAMRRLAWEGLAILLEIAGAVPESLTAFGTMNRARGALDFVSMKVALHGLDGFVDIGLGEVAQRCETFFASQERKAYIDELEPQQPVRLFGDRPATESARAVSCAAPGPAELARMQCLAFLEGAASPARAQAEADLWLAVVACWRAAEASLASGSAEMEVETPAASLRVIPGSAAPGRSTLPPLRVVS